MSLFRMLAIFFDVRQIVEDIDRAGGQAKHEEAGQRAQEGERDEKLTVEHQRAEDESVFRPLARAHGLEKGLKGTHITIQGREGQD